MWAGLNDSLLTLRMWWKGWCVIPKFKSQKTFSLLVCLLSNCLFWGKSVALLWGHSGSLWWGPTGERLGFTATSSINRPVSGREKKHFPSILLGSQLGIFKKVQSNKRKTEISLLNISLIYTWEKLKDGKLKGVVTTWVYKPTWG